MKMMILILRVIVVVLLLLGACQALDYVDPWLFLAAVGGLFLVAFWEHVKQLSVRLRTPWFGLDLERPEIGEAKAADSPDQSGDIRDNFLYLGNYYLGRGRHEEAFQHYQAAYRLKGSILAAFRCMQSAALAGCSEEVVLEWFQRALWHANGPWRELEGRQKFSEWVKAHTSLDAGAIKQAVVDIDF